MDSAALKRQNIKKKTPLVELPPNVLNLYTRIENLLQHSMARKWLRYEFQYDEVELAYFNKSKIFESILSCNFPQLNHRDLTKVEWRVVRKLCLGRKVRRFSPNFVQEQRIELEKYRRCYNVLYENQRTDQLNNLDVIVSNGLGANDDHTEIEILRLIIDTRKHLSSKFETVSKLREINNEKNEGRIQSGDETNANATKAIMKLRDCNEEITNNLKKMLCFQIVKEALLFDALAKERLFLALSPIYFRRKCDVRIYEDHHDFRSDTFMESDGILILTNILLEMALSLLEHDQITVIAGSYLKTLVQDRLETLEPLMKVDDFDYFNAIIVPSYLGIAEKACV